MSVGQMAPASSRFSSGVFFIPGIMTTNDTSRCRYCSAKEKKEKKKEKNRVLT